MPPRTSDQPQKMPKGSNFFHPIGNRVTYFARHVSKMLRCITVVWPPTVSTWGPAEPAMFSKGREGDWGWNGGWG